MASPFANGITHNWPATLENETLFFTKWPQWYKVITTHTHTHYRHHLHCLDYVTGAQNASVCYTNVLSNWSVDANPGVPHLNHHVVLTFTDDCHTHNCSSFSLLGDGSMYGIISQTILSEDSIDTSYSVWAHLNLCSPTNSKRAFSLVFVVLWKTAQSTHLLMPSQTSLQLPPLLMHPSNHQILPIHLQHYLLSLPI